MKSVTEQLFEFFRAKQGQVFASGDLQRMVWRNKNGSLATPRSIVRRLEELAEDGSLSVTYENSHAYYSSNVPPKKVQVVEYVERDGRRFAQVKYVTV